MNVESDAPEPPPDITSLLEARSGHFKLESGHHGDYWLDLSLLYLRPRVVEPYAAALADQLTPYDMEGICGPLIEGAFVAMMVAARLDLELYYAERVDHPERLGLFPVEYQIPAPVRDRLRGKRIAVVNDVTNAGSAVRGTLIDLRARGANVVAIATLLALSEAPTTLAAEWNLPLLTLASRPNKLWEPDYCPLCAAGIPLEDIDARLPHEQTGGDVSRPDE